MHLHPLDHRVLHGAILRAGLGTFDRVDRLHAGGDLAKDGVLAVQPGSGFGGHDEELAAVRVGSGIGHRERSADDLVIVDLVLELVAGSAGAGALRAAALDHEVADHAMEDQAVVIAVLRKLGEVVDGLGRVLGEQLHLDRAVVGMHRGLAHRLFATSSRSSTPRTSLPETLSATCWARSAGTSTKLKRSSTRTLRTSSFSRWVLSTTALTMSAGSRPSWRPVPTTSFV